MLVLNNAARMGYGGVTILNLFATLDDFDLRKAELDDEENLKIIVSAAKSADLLIYSAGVCKAKNKLFQEHPLSPAVRTWELSPLKVEELVKEEEVKPDPARKSKTPTKKRVQSKRKPPCSITGQGGHREGHRKMGDLCVPCF